MSQTALCESELGRLAGVHDYSSRDVHEYCANLEGWQLSYDQLSAGPFEGHLQTLRFSRLEVFRETTSRTLRQRGTLGADCFTIGVPWRGEGEARCNGIAITGPDALIMSFDAEIELFTPENFEVRGVSTSARFMEDLAGTLDVRWPHQHANKIFAAHAASPQVARLRRLVALAQSDEVSPQNYDARSNAARALEDALLGVLLDLAAESAPLGSKSARGRKRTVDNASALMLAQDGKTMTLLDVCRQIGVSPRKLTYCFREQLGIPPAFYWKVVRLNRVRKDLIRLADTGVDIFSVAARHGFWHFSQFSYDYRRHFAERPSETLRSARRRRAAN